LLKQRQRNRKNEAEARRPPGMQTSMRVYRGGKGGKTAEWCKTVIWPRNNGSPYCHIRSHRVPDGEDGGDGGDGGAGAERSVAPPADSIMRA
jgi:hypothetical protein